jgi:hypothetical protein
MAGYVKRMKAVVSAYVIFENIRTGNCVGDFCVYQNLLQLYEACPGSKVTSRVGR